MLDRPTRFERYMGFHLQFSREHENMSAGQPEDLAEETGTLLGRGPVFANGGITVSSATPLIQTLLGELRLMAHQIVRVLSYRVRRRLLQCFRIPQPIKRERPPLFFQLVSDIKEERYKIIWLHEAPYETAKFTNETL